MKNNPLHPMPELLISCDPQYGKGKPVAFAVFEHGELSNLIIKEFTTRKVHNLAMKIYGYYNHNNLTLVKKTIFIIESQWIGHINKSVIKLAQTAGQIYAYFDVSGFECHYVPVWGNTNWKLAAYGKSCALSAIEVACQQWPKHRNTLQAKHGEHLADAAMMGQATLDRLKLGQGWWKE